jgi:hypothetical protein
MTASLEDLFPGLRNSGYRISSPPSADYNCIAWALGETTSWWWPDNDPDNDAVYWPPKIVREETLAAFIAAFALRGFEPCASNGHEVGFEKVALFASADGVPTHATRQLPSGVWSSKIGTLEDIEHPLHALCGDLYGTVVQLLRRPLPGS